METEKITILANQLTYLKQSDWNRIKQVVDTSFSSKAAKVKLDDSEELKRRLKVAFNLQQSE